MGFRNDSIYCIVCIALGIKAFLKVKYLDLVSKKLSITVSVPELVASSGKMTNCKTWLSFPGWFLVESESFHGYAAVRNWL